MRVDWKAPVGGAAEILACVPGLKANTLAQWQARGQLTRRGERAGRAMVWHASDVLEVATLQELRRMGVLLDRAAQVWTIVNGAMIANEYQNPHSITAVAALFTVDETGGTIVRLIDELSDEGAGLERADSPDTFLVLRIWRLMEKVGQRIAAVAPSAVRAS